jgi:moderate conductance mechanosensitive channel
MPELQVVIDEFGVALALAALSLVVLVVATLIALRFTTITVRAALGRLFDREMREGTAQDVSAVELQRRRDTLEGMVNRGLRLIILVIAFLMGLRVLNLDIGPAIAGLGILGLALSLGAQNLVRDYVAGAFILIENQYAKGDVVSIAGISGSVEDVSLRRTTLRDLDGTVHHVPHGLIQTSSNLTRSWSRINLDVPVPYGTPVERISRVIDEAGAQLAQDPEWKAKVIEPPRAQRIDRLGDMGMMLKVLGVVQAAEQWSVAGELRRLIIEGCEREGLTLGWRTVTAVAIAGGDDRQQSGRKS